MTTTTKTPSKTPKLWEISEEVNRLEELLYEIESREDLTEGEREGYYEIALNNWLSVAKEFDDKACNVAAYIKHLEALAEARKNEYRRLRDLAEQSDKQAQRLRNYLIQNMQKLDKKKINGTNASLSLRKKPAKVILTCPPEDLPAKFMKVEISPRLSELKIHIQANPDCVFAKLADTEEYSVIIK